MRRRRYLTAVSTAAAGLLAGCVGGDDDGESTTGDGGGDEESDAEDGTDGGNTPTETEGKDGSDDTGDEDETDGEGGESGDDSEDESAEHEALAVVDAYFEAVAEEDIEALSEHQHSDNPFNVANASDEEELPLDRIDISNYERRLVDEDFPAEKIRNAPGFELLFQDADVTLDELLDGEEAVLVEAVYNRIQNGDPVEETLQFILLTEDSEWKVFLPYEEPSEVPEGDSVDDERYQVVDDIEFDTEMEMATVHVSSAGDIEAERLVAYSTSLQEDSSIWSEESETLPDVNYFAVPFDSSGDEIVVTIRFEDGEEIVVYRETYAPAEPDSESE